MSKTPRPATTVGGGDPAGRRLLRESLPETAYTLHVGDCLDVLRTMPDASVDAVVTDPPYGLSFMGQGWDRGVPPSDVWAECLRVLRPGGRLLAFAGTRTMHRMWTAIEDAGFIIEDSIAWMFGTGFPKHGSKLKPAYEPICVARKGPVSLLNIDACRIGSAERPLVESLSNRAPENCYGDGLNGSRSIGTTTEGRWPANVVLDEDAAEILDAQSGERPSRAGASKGAGMGYHGGDGQDDIGRGYGNDTGGASRFFYVSKASKKERGEGNTHPTVKPVALMRHLVRLVTPASGVVLDPFAGSCTTGVACAAEGFRFIGIENTPEYVPIGEGRLSAAYAAPVLSALPGAPLPQPSGSEPGTRT